MNKKCLVLFVEGDTEVEFYKQVVANARKSKGTFHTSIEYKNVKGIGGFKKIALRTFKNQIKPKYGSECEFTVALCRDTDVFDFASNPPITDADWDEIKQSLNKNGAADIIDILAKRSIEDWFLHDVDGILRFLKLSSNTKMSGQNGFKKLQNLYKQANRIYYKGARSNDMIKSLDITKITKAVSGQLLPLYNVLK